MTLPCSQEEFTVPRNVYLIGTMNTADRSIALLDTALRRRFDFIEMMPRPDLLPADVEGLNLQSTSRADVDGVFRNKIISLLREYFFDDGDKINEVLPEGYKLC